MRLLAVVLVLLAACSVQPSIEQKMMDPKPHDSMMINEPVMEKEPAMMPQVMSEPKMMEEAMIEQSTAPQLLAGAVSKYYQWDKAMFDKAVADGKIVYLEFYANWCPICKRQHPELVKGFEELNSQKVVGFRIPYKDSETTKEHEELARQYGITYQHTKVILKDAKVALKNPEEWDSARFVSELKKVEA